MSTARSLFTEAIEDHLALKKQNASLEAVMPLARYDVGDPLDRYPGGPSRTADPSTVFVADADAPVMDDAAALAAQAPAATAADAALVGPSPEQAMEAATALETTFDGQPFAPLNGLAPMLSLVEDIDEDGEGTGPQPVIAAETAITGADVLRFPGGVGPREDAAAEAPAEPQPEPVVESAAPSFFDEPALDPLATQAFTMPSPSQVAAPSQPVDSGTIMVAEPVDTAAEAATGEQPVLVIDTDEPLAPAGSWADEPTGPARESRRSKPRFFGFGRKKKDKGEGDTWFTDGPRDFNWD